MQLISYLTQHYFHIRYENFTGKLIAALAIFQVIKPTEGEKKLFNDDNKALHFIEENTDNAVRVSLYKLDRIINPSKKDFDNTDNVMTFFQKGVPKESPNAKISLTESQMQYYLCKAIRKVTEIVTRNLDKYCDEFAMPKPDIDTGASDDALTFKE